MDFSNCVKCGVRFRMQRPTQKFCTKKCVRQPLKPKKCKRCKATFQPQRASKVYCSEFCYHNRNYALHK